MIWRSNPTTWFVLTPDGDFYQEDWSGLGDDGPVSFKVKGKGMDFQYFSRITQPVYRFREHPDDETFKGYIEQALTELGELGTGTFSWTPRKIYQMDGREVEASEFWGRLLVPNPSNLQKKVQAFPELASPRRVRAICGQQCMTVRIWILARR